MPRDPKTPFPFHSVSNGEWCPPPPSKLQRASADDEVSGALEFKEEEIARCEGLELPLSAGLPEVDFFDPVLFSEELEPVEIGDADV